MLFFLLPLQGVSQGLKHQCVVYEILTNNLMKKLLYLCCCVLAVAFASCESNEPSKPSDNSNTQDVPSNPDSPSSPLDPSNPGDSNTSDANEPNGIVNGHIYVDLGLSVKWAITNVGADAPEGYGDYFAWGETQPKEVYDWNSHKFYHSIYGYLTKYCSDYVGFNVVDYKTVLEPEDDAASVNWGGAWRTPTEAELDELLENCTWTFTTQNGVNGYKVTSKLNTVSIFLPASGVRNFSNLYDVGSYASYWSSSVSQIHSGSAYTLYLAPKEVCKSDSYRCYGRVVRPVMP